MVLMALVADKKNIVCGCPDFVLQSSFVLKSIIDEIAPVLAKSETMTTSFDRSISMETSTSFHRLSRTEPFIFYFKLCFKLP